MLSKDSRRKIKRKILLAIVPKIGFAIVWLLYASCRNRFHIHEDFKRGGSIIAFWHGELLMLPFLYRHARDVTRICVMISDHFDGELIATLQGYFGFDTIRGSKSKNGTRALIGAINKLKENYDVAITPDGPKGPYHSVADGIVAIAQKTNATIIVVHTKPSRFWQFKTWDKFQIPKPFSRIDYYASSAFRIDKNMSKEDAKKLVYEKMVADCDTIAP